MNKLLISTLLVLSSSVAYAKDLPFDGYWKLNLEESEKVSETFEEGSGIGKRKLFQNVSVSVGGLPLPSRTRVGPKSGLSPKNPEVLVCTEMQIDITDNRVNLNYDQGVEEQLRRGHYRGRDTEWSKRKIQQKYKTPDRKVTKTWTMRKDGRLLVEVKLNPPKDRAQTFRRVFDRVDPNAAEAPTAESSENTADAAS